MEKVILIRFGEIFLKGKNRGFFEKVLVENIKEKLKEFDAEVVKIPGRYIVQKYRESDEIDILETLEKIPGIFSFSKSAKIVTDLNKIDLEAITHMYGEDKVNFVKNYDMVKEKIEEIGKLIYEIK